MRLVSLAFAAVVGLCLSMAAAPASAQATRTWVSGVGDDVNPCSRTAPCRTFAGAISKTAAGGEISVLDPGGFGPVSITKNLSIVNEAAEASILAGNTNGITINGAGIVVNLRGLIIDGTATEDGDNGILFVNGAALHISNSTIRNFRSATAGAQFGILFAPSSQARLDVVDTVIGDNGTGIDGGGILVKPAPGGGAKVSLNRVTVMNNVTGVKADGGNSSGVITVSALELTSVGNTYSGLVAVTPAGGATVRITADHSTLANNGTGANANGAAATLRIGRSTISGNTTGVSSVASGSVLSYGTNQMHGNTADGAFTGTAAYQ